MIIDLQAQLNKKALGPLYDVGVETYQPGQMKIDLSGTTLNLVNDALSQMPADTKEIKADEITFNRQSMEYFRSILYAATERLKRIASGLGEMPVLNASQPISSYLRPMFSMAANGYDYWDALREIDKRTAPIPKDYLIILPDAGVKNPDRDDIIRALVPFKKAQREALLAGWQDGTTAIRIRHSGVSAPSFAV